VRVKICGINAEAAFDAAVGAGADWVGFVFAPASPRAVTAARAAALSARAAGGPRRVGLFVEPDDAMLQIVLDTLALDALQLYAPPARCAEIAARTGLPVWRSVAVTTRADLPDAPDCDAWVIEPRAPAGAGRPGGLGATMDWTLLRGWHTQHPWLLAGGLTPDNVRHAITESGARAVDVSSGVESETGVKAPRLIAEFVRQAKEAVLF
jgi:phosphoribosylanthranilate isomerase